MGDMDADSAKELVERFKTKIKEAIEILPLLPEEERIGLWSYWQVVSTAVRRSAGGKGPVVPQVSDTYTAGHALRGRGKRFRGRQKQESQNESKVPRKDLESKFAESTKENQRKKDENEVLLPDTGTHSQILVTKPGAVVKLTGKDKAAADASVAGIVMGGTRTPVTTPIAVVKLTDKDKAAADATAAAGQLSLGVRKLKAFVHISDSDRAAADAATNKQSVAVKSVDVHEASTSEKHIGAETVLSADKTSKAATDAATSKHAVKSVNIPQASTFIPDVSVETLTGADKTSKENVDLSKNAASIGTPKRGRGRPPKPKTFLANGDTASISASSDIASKSASSHTPSVKTSVSAVVKPSTLKTPVSSKKSSDVKTSDVKTPDVQTPGPSAESLSSASSDVRRSGRRSMPKKDDIYCYFPLKESGAKVENDLDIEMDTAEDEEVDSMEQAASMVEDDASVEFMELEDSDDDIALIADGEGQKPDAVKKSSSDRSVQTPAYGPVAKATVTDIEKKPLKKLETGIVAKKASTSTQMQKTAVPKQQSSTPKIEMKVSDAEDSAGASLSGSDKESKGTPQPVSVSENETEATAQSAGASETNGKSWRLKVPLTSSEEEKLRKRTCQECGIVLLSHSSMSAHMRTHSGEKPWSCIHCDKAFTTKANCERHQLTHEDIKAFPCTQCGFKFTEKKSLQIHMRRHTGERPYECGVCHQKFNQKGTLRSHMDVHMQLKRHMCSLCGEKFRQSTNLRMHIIRHHYKTKNFNCGHCDLQFYTKMERVRHEMTHSGQRPFGCDQCEQTFTRKQSLKDHQNLHSGLTPYNCCVCGMQFHDFASCHRHIKRHEKGNVTVAQARGSIVNEDEDSSGPTPKLEDTLLLVSAAGTDVQQPGATNAATGATSQQLSGLVTSGATSQQFGGLITTSDAASQLSGLITTSDATSQLGLITTSDTTSQDLSGLMTTSDATSQQFGGLISASDASSLSGLITISDIASQQLSALTALVSNNGEDAPGTAQPYTDALFTGEGVAEGGVMAGTADGNGPTISGNVIVTVDGGKEIHLQIPEGMSTEQLVAHVQDILREQNMDLSGNQTIVISDDTTAAAAPTSVSMEDTSDMSTTAGATTTSTAPGFIKLDPPSNFTELTIRGSTITNNLQASESDEVLENVFHIPEGPSNYQVTLFDPSTDVQVVMEDGSVMTVPQV